MEPQRDLVDQYRIGLSRQGLFEPSIHADSAKRGATSRLVRFRRYELLQPGCRTRRISNKDRHSHPSRPTWLG
jgi:hypothetical protein